ncbi:MAG TPA: hypothetical protein VK492_04045 [Chitinophagaceae bacterium]|nr:hypothetical protein [Chitinophagaceae bacterium]
MRIFLLLLFIFSITNKCNSQILKKVGDKVKRDAEWRARYKADQQVNKGIDSLIAAPKKASDKKKAEKSERKTATVESTDNKNEAVKNNISADVQDENDMTPKDGFLTLTLSNEEIFTGGSILISGESVKYKNFNQVEIKVKGPSGVPVVKSIPLMANGKFNAEWISSNVTGDFTVTVTTGDKKAVQTAKFTVSEMELIFDDEWPESNIKATKDAYNKLDDAVDKAETGLGSKDKAELDKKLAEVKEKVDASLKLFKDLNSAAKEITRLCKTGKKLSPNLAGNLSALNNNLTEHASQMKSIGKLADHQPQDNTVCEHLVMVSEACAAFSAFTNFWSKSVTTILLNITLDKGVPKAAEIINSKTVDLSSPNDFLMKEPAKIFATAAADAESLTSKLGTAGFAGDITQFASDFLLKKYCGVYKGEMTHDYTVEFRNKDGVTWWKYGVVMKGALSLRYPKEGSKGKIIKMKGNLEGNATKFTFYQNVEADDGFLEGSKGKIEVVELKVLKPPAIPFVSSLNDPAGFGAVARTLATPACFNIIIDAEYDVDADKIKIFVEKSLIDFSPAVNNQLIFLLIGADLLPYFKKMTFPIHKVYNTLGSVVRDHNEFTVEKNPKGNLSFSGKANKHLGDKTEKIEHDLNFSISAKKE